MFPRICRTTSSRLTRTASRDENDLAIAGLGAAPLELAAVPAIDSDARTRSRRCARSLYPPSLRRRFGRLHLLRQLTLRRFLGRPGPAAFFKRADRDRAEGAGFSRDDAARGAGGIGGHGASDGGAGRRLGADSGSAARSDTCARGAAFTFNLRGEGLTSRVMAATRMTLAEVLEGVKLRGELSPRVGGVDGRGTRVRFARVEKDFLFFAFAGARVDGRQLRRGGGGQRCVRGGERAAAAGSETSPVAMDRSGARPAARWRSPRAISMRSRTSGCTSPASPEPTARPRHPI